MTKNVGNTDKFIGVILGIGIILTGIYYSNWPGLI